MGGEREELRERMGKGQEKAGKTVERGTGGDEEVAGSGVERVGNG